MLNITLYLFQLMWCPFCTCSIFAVTVSSQVRGGKQETLCAQIHGPTEPIALTVALEMDSGSTVILEEAVKQDYYRCLNFQVWLNTCTLSVAVCRVGWHVSLWITYWLFGICSCIFSGGEVERSRTSLVMFVVVKRILVLSSRPSAIH